MKPVLSHYMLCFLVKEKMKYKKAIKKLSNYILEFRLLGLDDDPERINLAARHCYNVWFFDSRFRSQKKD